MHMGPSSAQDLCFIRVWAIVQDEAVRLVLEEVKEHQAAMHATVRWARHKRHSRAAALLAATLDSAGLAVKVLCQYVVQ